MQLLCKQMILNSIFIGAMVFALPAAAMEVIPLTIKGHTFEPAEITIPANTKVKLLVRNQDPTPEEFESHSLHREKLIPAGAERTIFIGPLDAGSYEFFGEFNPKTAKGRIIVK